MRRAQVEIRAYIYSLCVHCEQVDRSVTYRGEGSNVASPWTRLHLYWALDRDASLTCTKEVAFLPPSEPSKVPI